MEIRSDKDVLVKQMQSIPLKDLVGLFNANKITLDKKIQMDAMRNALRPYVVKTRHECLTLDSRKNYRLLWFNIFSQTQLELLFDEFKLKELDSDYVQKLYHNILRNVDDSFISTIEKLAKEAHKKIGDTKISAKQVNKGLQDIFTDEKGWIDGLELKDFRPIIFNSATVEQIIKIGKKYNITIPEKLTGDVLREYVHGKMTVKGKLNQETEEIIKTETLTKVKELAKKNGIYISVGLNKKETIEYLLQRAETIKDIYSEPHSDSVYEMGIPVNADEDKYSNLLIEYTQLTEELEESRKEAKKLQGEEKKLRLLEIQVKEEAQKEHEEKLLEIQKKFNERELEGKQLQEEKAKLEKKVESLESENTKLKEEENKRAQSIILNAVEIQDVKEIVSEKKQDIVEHHEVIEKEEESVVSAVSNANESIVVDVKEKDTKKSYALDTFLALLFIVLSTVVFLLLKFYI